MKYKNHIKCSYKELSSKIILPGDPQRSKYIAVNYLDNYKKIAYNREYQVYTGYYNDQKVSICSTGIGCPSTAIAVEELINQGAKQLIRVGTCGGALKKDIKVGSIIIPTASIREENTTKEYIGEAFPAVADYKIINSLEKAANQNKFVYYIGINRTHDAFYGSSDNIKKRGKIFIQRSGLINPIISSDMETSALLVISSLRGVQAGAVLAVNSSPEDLLDITSGKQKFIKPDIKQNSNEAKLSIDRAIIVALDAIISN